MMDTGRVLVIQRVKADARGRVTIGKEALNYAGIFVMGEELELRVVGKKGEAMIVLTKASER